MRYVVNQENGQRYYPFIFRRNYGGSIAEYPYALAGNHMFWCGEDLDSLRLQFSVNGYSEVTTGKVSYEFQELLVSVAKENDALAQQDDTTKRECELLNRFAEDYMVDYDEERMKSFWTWAKSAIEEISLKRYSLLARVCGYWDGETKDRYFSSVEELMEVCEYNDLLNCTRVFVNCIGGTTEEATFQELFDLNGTQSTQEIEEKDYNLADFEFQLFMRHEGEVAYLKKLLNPSLEIVHVPESYKGKPVTGICQNAFNSDVIATVSNVFSNDKVLVREIILPESIVEFEEGAFYGARKLEKVHFSGKESVIPESCFAHCEALKEIALPEGVKEIKKYAFEDCASLEKIDLPDTLEVIREYAFVGCKNLKTIKLPGGIVSIGEGFDQPVTLVTDTHQEEIAQYVENHANLSMTYEVLDDSLKRREQEAEQTRLEEERQAEKERNRETERIVAEREKRYEEKLRRSRISLHSIYESIYGKEEIKTVYVKDKNSYEEIYAALSKAYTGAFSTVFLESVEHILQNAEDEKMQVAMLSGIVNVEEVDASDERLIENQKFEMDELTPEAEKLINNLKKFLADMPFAGERPVYEVTDKSDVDEIIDELLGTLQSSGNMMHVMQLKAYRHSSAISGSRAAKIELIKICADVTQPENEKSEEVIETEESEPAGEEMETGEETCQEDMPELQYKELTDGTMALFCYASSNWRLLIDDTFEEEKIPVMIWNNYLCYANSEQLKKVNLADGEVRIRDVSDVQAGNFSVSIEANILSNADFVIDDENEELILKAFT